jgi:hypothetical protein
MIMGQPQLSSISAQIAGNPRPARLLREDANRGCTNSGHSPVDWLHSIENTRVASGDFSLTKKIEGVEQ